MPTAAPRACSSTSEERAHENSRIAAIPGGRDRQPVTDGRSRRRQAGRSWRSCALTGAETCLATGAMTADRNRPARLRRDLPRRGAGPPEVPELILPAQLLPIRKAFAQYANVRPHRLLPSRRRTDFDILCVRGNTPAPAGTVHVGTRNKVAVETTNTQPGTASDRILRFGFEQARRRRGKQPR